MTIDDLEKLLASANWSSHLCESKSHADFLSLDSMPDDEKWTWLPTSMDQKDPIHGNDLRVFIDENGKKAARKQSEFRAVKAAVISMRSIDRKFVRLVNGPHDLNIAAQSAAQFAARMAAREIVAEKIGFWCRAVEHYSVGYWPCGLTEEGKLIVY